ncbi:MAG TPA: spore coat U domain-containing protein, partial [Gammaproteobacteria bacterium]
NNTCFQLKLLNKGKIMNKSLLSAAMLLSGLAVVGSAHAGTVTTTLDVSAIVGIACSVSTAPVVFNVTDPFQDTFANGSVTVTCNPGMPFDIALDAGQNYNGSLRGVKDSGGNRLDYDLGSTLGGQPWGDNGLTYWAPVVIAQATGGADEFTVYGTLWGGQPAFNGVYSDVVSVTVTY